MSKKIIITGGGTVSGSRAEYISKSKISKDEATERRLFTAAESNLTRHKATMFLGGNDKPGDGELIELVFSLQRKDFNNFGESLEERKDAMQEVVREGLDNLFKELGVKNVRYAAGIHLNTNNPHAHIIYMKDAFDIKTGEYRDIPKIPRSWFWRNDGENSKLGKFFEQSVASHTKALPPQTVLTKLPEENLFLPAQEIDEERIERTLNRLSEVNNISPHWIESLTKNRSLFVSRQGSLVFIRRDTNGNPTGYIYPQGYQPSDEKGFFYIGNPKTATRFIIVENPKEALSALELSGHRDLSEVCFVASDKKQSPEAFTNFLRERSNEKSVRVIWALGLNRDNVQEQTHYEDFRIKVLENRKENAPALEFFTWSPKQGFGKDWSNQLAFRNLPGELNGIMKKILVADEQIAESLDRELTESYNARVSETFNNVEIKNESDEFIVYEKTETGTGIEYGRYRQNADELAEGKFTLLSVKGTPIENETVGDELDAINRITNLFVDKLEQEFFEAEAAKEITESETLNENSANVEKAETILETKPEPQISAKEVTERLKQIPLEDVMPVLGLSLTYDRDRREYAYTDNGKLFKIKVKNDLFCNRYDDDRGGRNPINLVMHVGGKSFTEARQFLLDHFGTEYIPQQSQAKARIQEENAKTKQLFVMPEPNDNKLLSIHNYLTEERAISDVIVNGMIERGFLFANNFGSPVFVNKDENGTVRGASWRATIGNKRGDYAGSEKVNAWFYIGDLNTASKFIIVESPIEAMSYFQLHQDSIDLERTAVISTATNSVPMSLVKLLEKNAGENAELVIAYNNDVKGQDGALYLLEKIGQLSMLKHKEHFKNGLIETTDFSGKVYLDIPQLEDWNEDLKALRETERYEFDSEHIAEEMETELRPELPEQTQELITLDNFQIISMEGRIRNEDGSERIFPVSFNSITEFDDYIKNEKPLSGSYKTDVIFSLSDNSSVEQTFLIGDRHAETFEGLLKEEISKLESMKKLDTYKDEVEAIDNEIGGYKYILNAVQKIQTKEIKEIAREENPAILEAEERADYYEADLIKSVKVSVPQHLQSFGKAEILLARDDQKDKNFHVGFRFTIGGKVFESLPDRTQKTFNQGKESLSFGHALLREKINSYWQENGEPKFTKAETHIEPNEDKFLAYILHKSEISAREFYVNEFEPSFSIKPELTSNEISMLRKWRELTKEDQFYKIEDVFAGNAMEANPKRNLMYKLVSEGLIKTKQEGVHTLVKGLQPLTPEALTLIGKKSFSQILKSNDSILRDTLNKKLETYAGKLQDNRLHSNDREFYAQQYQKTQSELKALDEKENNQDAALIELNTSEAAETGNEIVLGINPGEDYDLLIENPLKGVYDLKAHKINQAFRETYIPEIENSANFAFAFRNRVVTVIGADDQGNMQVNFRAEGSTNEGKTQGYILNQLINEGILSKDEFERLVKISRTKIEIRDELINLSLHTEHRAEYETGLIYKDSAAFRINSNTSEGDYVIFKNLDNGRVTFAKFGIEIKDGQKLYSFDQNEQKEFPNIGEALAHLQQREVSFAENTKSVIENTNTTEKEVESSKRQAVLIPLNQEGRIEKRIAKILHSHNLAQEIADAQEGFYVKLKNDPYMDLHITKEYGSNLIRLTHYYEQNGDLMHDGEMNFRLDDAGKLTLNQIAVGWYGTPRYAYDRSFANMFSKNLIDQGFETAKVIRMHDEFQTTDQIDKTEITGSDFKPFNLPEAWKEVDHFGASGEIHINAEDRDAYARTVFNMAENFFNDFQGIYTVEDVNTFVENNLIRSEGEFYIHFERALELIDITYREQQLESQKEEEFASHFTQISEEEFRNEIQIAKPVEVEYFEVENLLEPENRQGKAVEVLEVKGESGLKLWVAKEYWERDSVKPQMTANGHKETGRIGTIYTNANINILHKIDEAAETQLKLNTETAQQKIENFVRFLKAEYPELGFSGGYIGNHTPLGDEAQYAIFTKIEFKGQWGTQRTKFGYYDSYEQLAKDLFETDKFDEFLYDWQKINAFQSNVEVTNTLNRIVATGDKPLARYLSGEAKPRRVFTEAEKETFFEQFKGAFNDHKIQEFIKTIGNIKERQANVADLTASGNNFAFLDVERAEKNGFITVQKAFSSPEQNRVELTENGKIVFEYLNRREIAEGWKADEIILSLVETAHDVQKRLDEKFSERGMDNPWIAKPDFDENIVEIGQKGSLNPKKINGYPEFAIWAADEDLSSWKIALGKVYPATREDPEDFQFEPTNMRYPYDSAVNELFTKHLLQDTNLSTNRLAPEGRYKLALEIEPAGVKKGTISLANEVRELLHEGKSIGNNVAYNKMCESHFGGTRAAGTFDARDAYDALELGVNLYLLDQGNTFIDRNEQEILTELRQLLRRLPTQADRTEEQQLFQQFSTVPTESYAAFAATGLNKNDVLLEPSAGIAGLAVWSKIKGAKTHVNEITDRRAGILKIIGFDSINRQDAQFLNDTLDQSIKPTVILMNPPFSSTGGRTRNRTKYGAEHITDALLRLQDGGRLVAIVGEGMAFDKPTFTSWWSDVMNKYNVRANLSVPGDEYAKYGTSFGNQILVIDKTGATPGATMQEQLSNVVKGDFKNLEQVLEVTRKLGAERTENDGANTVRFSNEETKDLRRVGEILTQVFDPTENEKDVLEKLSKTLTDRSGLSLDEIHNLAVENYQPKQIEKNIKHFKEIGENNQIEFYKNQEGYELKTVSGVIERIGMKPALDRSGDKFLNVYVKTDEGITYMFAVGNRSIDKNAAPLFDAITNRTINKGDKLTFNGYIYRSVEEKAIQKVAAAPESYLTGDRATKVPVYALEVTHEARIIAPGQNSKVYDLGYGHLGNGITVWNRAEEVNRDYKTIAHIGERGIISLYEKNLPENVINEIFTHNLGNSENENIVNLLPYNEKAETIFAAFNKTTLDVVTIRYDEINKGYLQTFGKLTDNWNQEITNAINRYAALDPVEFKELTDKTDEPDPLAKLYEKARWEGIGIATGGRIERIEERGYRVIFGEAKGERRYDIAGIIGPATDKYIERGLTIEKVKFSNFEIVEKITRNYVKNNPDKVFLFGDNLKHYGNGGQAREMRGEPNAIGIPTKKEPSRESWAYFKDSEIDNNKSAIDKAFAKLAKYTPDTVIVFPKAGIGTGLAELEQRAPETFAYLQEKLNAIGLTDEVIKSSIKKQNFSDEQKDVAVSDRQKVEVGATQETVTLQMELLGSLPFEERELEINDPIEEINLYDAGVIESKGAIGFSEFHNKMTEADWEESQVKTLILNGLTDDQKIGIIEQFKEVNDSVEIFIDGDKFTLVKDGVNQYREIIRSFSAAENSDDPGLTDERIESLEKTAEKRAARYSETAKALNILLEKEGRGDIVPEVFVEIDGQLVTSRIDVYKIDSVNGDRVLIGEITQGTDQYQYSIGDEENEVYDIEILTDHLITAVNAYSVKNLSLNTIPEIDVQAWEKATSEDRNYHEDEDNFTPEEVRAEYFQQTMNLTEAVKQLTEAVKVKPTTKKAEAALKKNQEKLEDFKNDLGAHIANTGKYFGKASEDFLRNELHHKDITLDADYNVIVKADERSQPHQILETNQPARQQSLFDAPEEKAIGTPELVSESETDENEIVLPDGYRFLTEGEKDALLPHEKGKIVHGETTSIVKDAAIGSKWLNAYDGNVYEVISLVKEKYTQIAYVRDQDGNVDKEPTAGGYARPIFIALEDSSAKAGEIAKEEDINDVIGIGRNTAKREKIGNLGVVSYKPAKLTKGVDHPGDIVESASMAAVEPPDIKYTPKLDKKLIKDGKLSSLQLEAVIYAGQRHEHRLPNGMRAGFFIGDGTGVGKGRELAGIAVDNWNQGRKRVLWLSINYDLVPSTKRDLDDLNAREIPLNSLDKHSIHDNLNDTVGDSVLFASYATLIGKGKDEKTRFDQIVKWLGEDGVIMFDEGHLAKNAVSFGMGVTSQRGEAVVELQIGEKSNPNWRIVYSSATGATELANMGYMERLGLWGEGTGFPGGFGEFHNAIDKGGIGAMEMVARDMKAAGMYMSRSLSYRGVDYRQVHHELTEDQKEIYNLASRAWSSVVVNFDEALRSTNANSKTRKMAYAQLWSGEQMFYRQLLTALKVPAVIRETERILENSSEYTDPITGQTKNVQSQIVIGVIGTGEARTKDQVSKAMQMGLDLDTLDFSPKNILLNVVEKSFPTKRFTEELDPASGKTIKVPVIDKDGRHVESQEALMMRDALLAELNEKVNLPDNPLDQIVNYFGANAVAEITGRKRRIIIDPNTGEKQYVKRAREGVAMDKASQDEMSAFQEGRKRIAIISQSASTGISLHADQRSGSKDFRRIHITLETSWSADVQMQTFGRTHRSNQSMPPEYVLMSTDLGGEKRFLSTIAKRLSSLGALTKGDREQAGGGNLLQYDFENKYGTEAAKKIVAQLRDDKASLMTLLPPDPTTGEERSGLKMLYTMGLAKRDGNAYVVTEETMKNLEVSRFLNRVLMLDVETQNAVFDSFVREMEGIIEHDKALGLFDEGVQDIEGENIRFAGDPRIVATDKSTGAHTFYNQIQADVPTHPVTLREITERNQVVRLNGIPVAESKNKGVFYQQLNSKNIIYSEFVMSRANPKTGSMENFYRFARPSGWQSNLLSESDLMTKFSLVQLDQTKTFKDDVEMTVKEWWNKAVTETPKTQVNNYHLISGAVLPVWQRLSSSNEAGNQMSLKTVRIETQDGERVVGVQIPGNHINRVLRDLGVEQSYKTPEEVFDAVIETKETIDLVGGIKLKPEFLKKNATIRIMNLSLSQEKEFHNFGALQERPGMEIKYFVPNDREKGIEVLSKILERYPAVDTSQKHTVELAAEKTETEKKGNSFADSLQNAIDNLSGKNGLGDGLLADIADKNSDFAKKASALEGEHISKYWWMMKAEVNEQGHILLNPASYEFARTIYKESMGIRVEQFGGLFNNELVTEKFFDVLDRKQSEAGIYAESIASLAETLRKGKDSNDSGILVLLADEKSSMHEGLHVASHVASLGKSLEDRHARFDELRNHETYLLAKDTLIGLHKTDSDGLLVEECFVECASGKADKLGLLPDEAAEFTELWFKSFAEKNGIITKEQFKELTDESRQIRDRAYAIIAEEIGRTAEQSGRTEGTGKPLGEFSQGRIEGGSDQTQSGIGIVESTINNRNREILNRALENGESVKAGMLFEPAEQTGESGAKLDSEEKPKDEIFATFESIFKEAGLEKILESNDGVVKFETPGRYPVKYEMEITPGLIKFAEMELVFENSEKEIFTEGRGIYFNKNADGKFEYDSSFEREGYMTTTEPVFDKTVGSYDVNFWKSEKLGSEIIVKEIDIEPEIALHVEKINDRNLEKYHGEQLGVQLLSDAKSNEAESALNKFEREKNDIRFTIKITENDTEKVRTVSLSELEGERKAIARTAVKDDKQTGILAMIAEDERKPVEEIEKRAFRKALREAETEQMPLIKAVETEIVKKRAELTENIRQADLSRNSVLKNTEAVIVQDNNRENVKPILPIEKVWSEQIKAAQRGDVEIFSKLEEIHRDQNVPRPNDVYARLRGVEMLTGLIARQEDKKLIEWLDQDEKQKRIVVEIKPEDEKLKVQNHRIEDVKIKHQELIGDYAEAKREARNEQSMANRAALQPLINKINPFSPVQGTLAWFTNPKETLNAHINPVEIIKNDPSVQIIRAVANYFDHRSKAKAMEEIAQEALNQAEILKSQFAPQVAENANKMANSVRDAVEREEVLRADLRQNPMTDQELLKTPERALTDAEMKQIGDVSAKLGDSELLDKFHSILENDSSLAENIGETSERIVAKSLLSQARAASASTQAIERINLTETGTIEVEINPSRFIEAKNQLETSEVAESFQNRMIENAVNTPRLNLQETQEAENLMSSLTNQNELNDFISDQYSQVGNGLIKPLVQQPLTAAEQELLNQMSLPQNVMERFDEIAKSEATTERLYLEAEKAVMNNIPFQNTGQTFQVINPGDSAEAQAREFWKNDRAMREQEIIQDNMNKAKTIEAEAESVAEAEAVEIAEAAEEIEATEALLAL